MCFHDILFITIQHKSKTHMCVDNRGCAELVYAAGRQGRVRKLACIFIWTQSNTDKTVSNWLKLNF